MRNIFKLNKTIAFLSLFFIMAFVIWFFFIQSSYRTPFSKVHSIEAIPNNAGIIAEFQNYFLLRYALTNMPYSDELKDVFFVKKMSDDFAYLEKLFANDENHRKLLIENSITASIHLSGTSDADFLYVIND